VTASGEASGTRVASFPAGFLWGAATSSHQVEGDSRWNDWWPHERAGRLPHASAEACRHYELYEADFDMARSWGHNAHRFSIAWSRIEPREGHWDEAATAHYQDVVDALLSRGIEPIVTLHHFTNPAWFADRGGWARRDSADLFCRYVERVASSIRGVRYWITINEPTVYAKHGFVVGDWPPFRRNAWLGAARALRGMARAHARAYEILRRLGPESRVGFAHSAPWIEPCDRSRVGDRGAAYLRDLLLNRAFLALIDPPRRHPRRLDFLGINYYARTIVRRRKMLAPPWGEECLSAHHLDRGPFSDTGWEVYPPGLLAILEKFSRLGLPLMITENGVATGDENLRSAFLREHLAAVGHALERDIDVIGYLYWSLIDNYEWGLGTTARFGLAAVDFETQRRTARPAAMEYASVCRDNRLALPAPGRPLSVRTA